MEGRVYDSVVLDVGAFSKLGELETVGEVREWTGIHRRRCTRRARTSRMHGGRRSIQQRCNAFRPTFRLRSRLMWVGVVRLVHGSEAVCKGNGRQ